MKREENKKIVIEEKIELKDVTLQGDPCRNSSKPCRYDCCSDCHNNTTSWQSPMY